jgi:hypothetical protein
MSDTLMPFLWVVVTLPILVLMQRWIHAHLHGVSLLAVGRPEWAVIIYAIVLFPGVLLHELSHWLAATALGVRTGSLSLIPRQQPDGTLQLGYVEYYKGRTLGPIRESLIGGAPLLSGTALILLIGFRIFGVTDVATAVQTGDIDIMAVALAELFATPFILLWIYLIFAISNAMLPSRSDRRAWRAFIVILVTVGVALYLLGLQQALAEGLAGPLATVFGYLGTAFSIAVAVDVLFMALIALVENILSRVRGMSVVYGGAAAGET